MSGWMTTRSVLDKLKGVPTIAVLMLLVLAAHALYAAWLWVLEADIQDIISALWGSFMIFRFYEVIFKDEEGIGRDLYGPYWG